MSIIFRFMLTVENAFQGEISVMEIMAKIEAKIDKFRILW